MTRFTSASRQAAAARDVLDGVIADVPALPASCGRRGIRMRLAQAQASLAQLEAAVENPDDYLSELTRATTRLRRLIQALSGDRCGSLGLQLAGRLQPSLQSLEQAREPTLDELAQLSATPATQAATATFSVSGGFPAVFLSRSPVLLPTPEPSADDDLVPPVFHTTELLAQLHATPDGDLASFGDIQVEPEDHNELITLRAPSGHRGNIDMPGPMGEMAQIRRLARDCLQGIGALGNLRIVNDDERWSASNAKFERRLLAKLDALMALGEPGSLSLQPLEEAVDYASASHNDFFRSFARTLVLGCSSGDAAARAVTAAMLADDHSVLDAHVEALSLASSPALTAALGRVLRSADDARYLEAAVVALGRRALNGHPLGATVADVEQLLRHADDRVRAAATHCLAAHPEPKRAQTLLLNVLHNEVEETVVTCALETLSLFDVPETRRRLLGCLNEELAAPGTLSRLSRQQRTALLALLGNEADVALLGSLAAVFPAAVEALGLHGYAQSLPLLVKFLNHETTAPQAAAALHRISGALAGEDPYQPTRDAAAWQQWLNAEMSTLATGRLRFGQPYNLGAVTKELSTFDVPASLRKQLALELALAGGPRVDVQGWCEQQRQRLGP